MAYFPCQNDLIYQIYDFNSSKAFGVPNETLTLKFISTYWLSDLPTGVSSNKNRFSFYQISELDGRHHALFILTC
ncbi:hypothetical protein GQ43DRAFT_267200 [Delitschia confertaspora ATCC 74209]|uniref:Uncharacterized protein n=1 Tax=Delitschia confertaspora ATCC 74209 TaxID=1513339 RepID=A0A9P4JU58_9PLEO|nr:hypothetical protein GQ43DRAFT_267200 [Delitschia confertaspora ATCC 74209]